MKRYAVIVAGGQGLRMGSELPKQFLCIGGRPILMHTLEAFHRFDEAMQLILVLPHDHQVLWHILCEEYAFSLPYLLANGGETRFHSVKNGLACITGNGVVAIHDGVRPFVSTEVLERCFSTVTTQQAVLPVVSLVDTMRELTSEGSRTVNRDAYKLVQTPQVFDVALIKAAYEQPFNPFFTDDASVVEAFGKQPTLIEGNRENIKITTPFDLRIAEALLADV